MSGPLILAQMEGQWGPTEVNLQNRQVKENIVYSVWGWTRDRQVNWVHWVSKEPVYQLVFVVQCTRSAYEGLTDQLHCNAWDSVN